MTGSIAGPPPPPAVTLGPLPESIDAGALQHDLDLWHMAEQFFASHLGNVSPAAMSQPSAVPPWTRAHVGLHVAYNAEGLMRLLDWARTGQRNDMYPSREWRDQQIEDSVALTGPADIRDIVNETSIELGEAFAELPAAAWAAGVTNGQGRDIDAIALPWMRARELFIHAVDLGLGARVRDFPNEVTDRILGDVAERWRVSAPGAHFLLRPTDGDEITVADEAGRELPPVALSGLKADLVSYLIGRSAAGVTAEGFEAPPAPPAWL